jgi:hypothetical protein
MSVIVKQRMGSEAAATVEVVASSSHLDLACVAAGVSSSNDALDAVPRPVLEAPSTLAEHVEGLSQTWAVEGVRDLPSDGEPRRLLIGRVELPAETYLLAVPAVSTAVELRTALRTLPNLPWYPGAPMAVFFGSERTGQSQLPRSIPSQPTSVSFGPVQGLRARRLRTEAVAEAFNPTRTKEWRAWRFADRIEIVNRTGEPAKVEVHEPAVLALAQQVEVEDRSLPLPDPGKNRQDRRVWTVEVPARDTATVLSVLRIRARASGTIRELQALGLPETD